MSANTLAGLYPANKEYGGPSPYPDTAESVLVYEPGPDGYHDIALLDGDGNVIIRNDRAQYRIEAALSGDYGYDLIVRHP